MTWQQPHTQAGREAVAAILAHPQRTLLATDFDGVLAPIVIDSERAYADPDAMAALCRLGGVLGQLVVITGRAALTAVRLGDLRGRAGLDRLVVLGQYGVERWDAETDELIDPEPPAGIAAMAQELPGTLAGAGHPDAKVEDKRRALVVHTRALTDPAGALGQLHAPVSDLAGRHDLVVEPGKNVLEVREGGTDKGHALRAIVAETGATTIIYAGDDLGDLPAFAAIKQFQADGIAALGVCSASVEQTALVEVSDLVVEGVPGVAEWLTGLADRLA